MPSREEILEKVQATLVDALGVDEDEVKGDAMLIGDLGAESIDFLDIVFRLEKNFGIKIPRGDLFPENLLSDPQFVAAGKVTEKGLQELRTRMPWADLDRLGENPNVQDLFTVNMIVNYVTTKLGANSK
jgi:acyl carrier protein